MKIFVPCLPVAQPRPRATTFNGKARMYEAKKEHPIHTFKASVKQAWHEGAGGQLQGEVRATLVFVFARPVKVPKKLGAGRLPHVSKPDLDNLAKGVCDSLNGLAYHDDSQVTQLTVSKFKAAEGEIPGVHITLESRP